MFCHSGAQPITSVEVASVSTSVFAAAIKQYEDGSEMETDGGDGHWWMVQSVVTCHCAVHCAEFKIFLCHYFSYISNSGGLDEYLSCTMCVYIVQQSYNTIYLHCVILKLCKLQRTTKGVWWVVTMMTYNFRHKLQHYKGYIVYVQMTFSWCIRNDHYQPVTVQNWKRHSFGGC